jgi:hypothetical protein
MVQRSLTSKLKPLLGNEEEGQREKRKLITTLKPAVPQLPIDLPSVHFRWLFLQLTELMGHQERCCLLACW